MTPVTTLRTQDGQRVMRVQVKIVIRKIGDVGEKGIRFFYCVPPDPTA